VLRWPAAADPGRLGTVTGPEHPTDEPNLHPGQYDEGGEGGMATRELAARHLHEDDEED